MSEIGDTSPLTLHLELFEGPLDLLLHLIKRQDIDILNIPIHQIAEEFQEYLEVIEALDLDRAGEYLAMAAELAQIKSRMLIPRLEEEGAEDPRANLVQRLVEHQQIREAAEQLEGRQHLGRDVFVRGGTPGDWLPDPPLQSDVSPVDLFQALRQVLKRATRAATPHRVRADPMSVAERMEQLLAIFRGVKQIAFEELFEGLSDRMDVVITFLALLELTRLHQAHLHQETNSLRIMIEPMVSSDTTDVRESSNLE